MSTNSEEVDDHANHNNNRQEWLPSSTTTATTRQQQPDGLLGRLLAWRRYLGRPLRTTVVPTSVHVPLVASSSASPPSAKSGSSSSARSNVWNNVFQPQQYLRQLLEVTYGDLLLYSPLAAMLALDIWQTFFTADNGAGRNGFFNSCCMGLVFFSATKSNSLFTMLFGISYEQLITFHTWAAVFTAVFVAFHLYTNYRNDIRHGRNLNMFPFNNIDNVSGAVLAMSFVLVISTSWFSLFRRRMFFTWLLTHYFFVILVILTAAFHEVTTLEVAAIWWIIDLIIRYYYNMRRRYHSPIRAKLRPLRGQVVEIRFRKPLHFQYQPGQFVQIAVHPLSYFQFHPFTLSSAPHEEDVTLHVKVLGKWTGDLWNLVVAAAASFSSGSESGMKAAAAAAAVDDNGYHPSKEVSLYLEGPFGGSPNLNDVRFDKSTNNATMVLCVCGGIGVTPCRSIVRSLIRDRPPTLQALQVVWSVRNLDLVEDVPLFEEEDDEEEAKDKAVAGALTTDSTTNEAAAATTASWVKAEIYVTKSSKSDSDIESNRMLGKPSPHTPQVVVHSGRRPNLDLTLCLMSDQARKMNTTAGMTRVAVFGCGPSTLMDALRDTCRKHNNACGMDHRCGVYFDLHVEVFEF